MNPLASKMRNRAHSLSYYMKTTSFSAVTTNHWLHGVPSLSFFKTCRRCRYLSVPFPMFTSHLYAETLITWRKIDYITSCTSSASLRSGMVCHTPPQAHKSSSTPLPPAQLMKYCGRQGRTNICSVTYFMTFQKFDSFFSGFVASCGAGTLMCSLFSTPQTAEKPRSLNSALHSGKQMAIPQIWRSTVQSRTLQLVLSVGLASA